MKLVSFGEICWDIYGVEKTLGGAPLNLAAHAALQGCEAYLLSAVGRDALGEEARRSVGALGVRTAYLATLEDAVTGQCLVTLDGQNQPHYRLLEDTAFDRIPVPSSLPSDTDVLAFGTLALRTEHNRNTLRSLLAAYRFPNIYTDLNIRPPFYGAESIDLCLSHATVVKISDEELPSVTSAIWGKAADGPTAVELMRTHYPQIRLVLLTMGEKGAACYDLQSGELYALPAQKVTPVSTVGAGDSFGASFLCRYMKDRNIHRAMEFAVRVSAHVVASKESVPSDMKSFLARSSH